MREIKFRVWDKILKGWSLNTQCWLHLRTEKMLFVTPEQGERYIFEQFTGFKDKNGKDIYEGDLIRSSVTSNTDYHGDWCINEVINQYGQWITSHILSEKGKLPRGYIRGFLLDNYDFDNKLFLWVDDYEFRTDIEVIGNIHENLELLEKN